MSEKIYDVPAEWKSRAFIDDAKYQAMYAQSIKDPNGFWAEAGQAHPLDEALHQGEEHLLRSAQRLDQMVRGRRHQRLLQLRRPSSRQARRSGRDHLGRRRSERRSQDHLSRTARRSAEIRQCAEGARRQEGRPRHDLHADDSRDAPTPCWPARASARSIRWCSAASRRTRSPAASRMPNRRS